MSWVIQKDPNLSENKKFSPWKGCLHILNGKGWYATSLAQPTQFAVEEEAHEVMRRLSGDNKESEFCVSTYNEVFPSKMSEAVSSSLQSIKPIPSNWNWNDDDIPF